MLSVTDWISCGEQIDQPTNFRKTHKIELLLISELVFTAHELKVGALEMKHKRTYALEGGLIHFYLPNQVSSEHILEYYL